jgi:glycosyltransferase involved in cell wall biosynthesis
MSDHDMPLVSVITPAHNAARFLGDLLRSVEQQDYPRIEHIVIDDGSSDGGATRAVLEASTGVRWWSRGNIGQYATLNEGFRAAAGDFVTTISADDTYVDAGAIAALARSLIDHPECGVAYGSTLHVDEDGSPLPVQPYQGYPPWMLRYKPGFVFHCSLLVRREGIIRDDVLFDETLRYVGDADWLIRLAQRYRFRHVDRYIGAYRHHGSQVSTVAAGNAAAEARRRGEHATLEQRYGIARGIKSAVEIYDTFHQRRVKALAAWRRGGSPEVLRTVAAWLSRKRQEP